MNISNTRDCYGCGVCAISCVRNIIKIHLNADGFYEPYISEPDKCTDCGLCMDVCAYNHEELSIRDSSISSWAAWSKDSLVRRKCSSGGVGFEIGKTIIAQGGKVCGVRFDAEKNQAEHYIASTEQELIPSIGSKYIQSYTVDGFNNIVKDVRDIKRKGENPQFLVTGTPCQIDSFRRYIQRFHLEDNFILLDFFCHGVPSKLMWDKYVNYVEKQVGKLTYVSWRNKFTGWHDSWSMSIDGSEHGEPIDWHASYNMLIKGKKSYLNSRLSQDDMFYRLFLSDACLGNACYAKCKYKYDQSSADIRIGDAWGETFKGNEEGISAAIAFTEKGKAILSTSNCERKEYPFYIMAEGQMATCPRRSKLYYSIKKQLQRENISITEIYDQLIKYQRKQIWGQRLKNPHKILLRLFKVLLNEDKNSNMSRCL